MTICSDDIVAGAVLDACRCFYQHHTFYKCCETVLNRTAFAVLSEERLPALPGPVLAVDNLTIVRSGHAATLSTQLRLPNRLQPVMLSITAVR